MSDWEYKRIFVGGFDSELAYALNLSTFFIVIVNSKILWLTRKLCSWLLDCCNCGEIVVVYTPCGAGGDFVIFVFVQIL